MSKTKWTGVAVETLVTIKNQGKISWENVAKEMKRAGFSFSAEACRNHYSRKVKTQNYPIITDVDYKAEIKKLDEYRNSHISSASKRFVVQRPPLDANYKVLALCDTHGLNFHDDAIKFALETDGDADALVIVGDFFDNHAMSSWTRHRSILLAWEYSASIKWMKIFSEMFEKVYLVQGNHEYRSMNYYTKRLDPEAMPFVKYDLLEHLANGYDLVDTGDPVPQLKKVHDFPNVFYDGGQLGWYTVVGKTIFVHPLRGFSKVRLKTMIQAYDYFRDREEDFECIVMGHTHRQGQTTSDDGSVLLLESGCACSPLPYEAEGRLAMSPQQLGHSVIYMDKDGHVDFNKSNTVFFGSGSMTKEVRHETK